ncbi:Ig domain-containing protein [Fictibacillus phosphorivorans]|uniref:Ig domain-containing protein n=1 Tax=Fictibacillus phosphorivorans TaxID=1221500 RepID=UPI00203B7D75|nr:Ig domain-containing protein [Fictibacillus phosphorivorans]MCM3719183.1 Ig domain-containing protein [Fictibacillus phosphorivorans]MCM3776805.1 Ig domain-containing protein [Fictibacillus phosphorivorans]
MINLFESNNEDLQYIVDNFGHEVSVNNTPVLAIITNNVVSEYEDRFISSIQPIERGDLVKDGTFNYLVITESVSKRYSKFKAIMRHCNYEIEIKNYIKKLIGYNDFGAPVYENQYVDSTYIHAIIDNKSFSVYESSIRLPDNQILVTLQENEYNKGKFTINDDFNVMDKSWSIINVDLTKKGLMILTCEIA